MEAASLWRRLGAFLVEVLLYWSVLLLAAFVTGNSIRDFLVETETGPRESAFGDRVDGGISISFPPGGIGLWVLLTYVAYVLWCETHYGQTLGKRLMGTRVVDQKTGGAINVGQSIVRLFFLYLGAITLFIPTLIVMGLSWNNQRTGDHLAKTVVIGRVRRAAVITTTPMSAWERVE